MQICRARHHCSSSATMGAGVCVGDAERRKQFSEKFLPVEGLKERFKSWEPLPGVVGIDFVRCNALRKLLSDFALQQRPIFARNDLSCSSTKNGFAGRTLAHKLSPVIASSTSSDIPCACVSRLHAGTHAYTQNSCVQTLTHVTFAAWYFLIRTHTHTHLAAQNRFGIFKLCQRCPVLLGVALIRGKTANEEEFRLEASYVS